MIDERKIHKQIETQKILRVPLTIFFMNSILRRFFEI